MEENNILILGAGTYQVPLIQAVKQLGYRAIVASTPGRYPGFKIADEVAYIDTRDVDKLLSYAQEKKIAAVVSACTDVSMPALGAINEEMGLAGIGRRTAYLSTNKIAMKNAFIDYGVKTARFEVLKVDSAEPESVDLVATKIGYPVIMKAIDSSGSRGITIINSKEDIPRAIDNMKNSTHSNEYLIEELLEGIEFGIQAFVQNGKIEFVMPHGDMLFHGSTAVPMGHYVPYGDQRLRDRARIETERAVQALGIENGALNIDAILMDDEVYIFEVGARAGATCLPELVSERYQMNYYEVLVRQALGETVAIPNETEVSVAGLILCPERTGVVQDVNLDDERVNITLDVNPGDEVREFKVGPDRIGQVVVVSDSHNALKKNLNSAIKRIHVTLNDGFELKFAQPDFQNN